MRRPVREGHLTIIDAINLVIRNRYADRHASIEQQEQTEDDARKRDFVPSGDPLRDAIIQQGWQPSRQLQKMVSEVFSDAQYLLRQWLCDGKIHAIYRDPIFGRDDIKVDPSVWENESTDEAINGRNFYPYGRSTGSHDQAPGAPVKVLRNELEAILRDASKVNTGEKKARAGAPETAVLEVIDAMLKAPRDHWEGVSLDSLVATFGTSPGTVKKARDRVVQQLAEKDANN